MKENKSIQRLTVIKNVIQMLTSARFGESNEHSLDPMEVMIGLNASAKIWAQDWQKGTGIVISPDMETAILTKADGAIAKYRAHIEQNIEREPESAPPVTMDDKQKFGIRMNDMTVQSLIDLITKPISKKLAGEISYAAEIILQVVNQNLKRDDKPLRPEVVSLLFPTLHLIGMMIVEDTIGREITEKDTEGILANCNAIVEDFLRRKHSEVKKGETVH